MRWVLPRLVYTRGSMAVGGTAAGDRERKFQTLTRHKVRDTREGFAWHDRRRRCSACRACGFARLKVGLFAKRTSTLRVRTAVVRTAVVRIAFVLSTYVRIRSARNRKLAELAVIRSEDLQFSDAD